MSKNPGIHPTMSALRFRDNGLRSRQPTYF
jgi:hypothetical protein